jgi:2-polyprenyl-3-methyl-5-hydroxy-6-metoxy-1,4-benzoquinol methylase
MIILEDIPCGLCDSRAKVCLYKKFDLCISQCTQCGFIFAAPRLPREEIWKRYSSEYFWKEYLPALGVHEVGMGYDQAVHRNAGLLSIISRHAQPPGTLLEVGAGAGFFLKAAQEIGWTVSGTEVMAAAVQFSRTELNLEITQASAEEMTFGKHSFNVVVMLEVIEHLVDPVRALQSIHHVLRPEGLLVLSTPNVRAFSRTILGSDWSVLSPWEHLYYFDETTLTAALRKTGFGKVLFKREQSGFSVYETMNPCNTHSPTALRARMYRALVATFGPAIFHYLERKGRGDTLMCFASPHCL